MNFNPHIYFETHMIPGQKQRCSLSPVIDSENYFVTIIVGDNRSTKLQSDMSLRPILDDLSQRSFSFISDREIDISFGGRFSNLRFGKDDAITLSWFSRLPAEWQFLEPLIVEIYRIAGWSDCPYTSA